MASKYSNMTVKAYQDAVPLRGYLEFKPYWDRLFAGERDVTWPGRVRLFPITGITLPFMSYGGSSLLASALIAALLGRVSHEERT